MTRESRPTTRWATHNNCTLELIEQQDDVADFECDECGEQYTLPIDEDGNPVDETKDGPT